MASRLQNPEVRERAIAGRLTREPDSPVALLTVEELLLLRAWLLCTCSPYRALPEPDEAWLASSVQASLRRAQSVGGIDPDQEWIADEQARRAQILAGHVCHGIAGSWRFGGARVDDEELIVVFPLAVGLNDRDTRWWYAALDFDPPADRAQQGPADDSDLIAAFLKGTCRRRAGSFASFTHLTEAYRAWAHEAALLTLEAPQLIAHLEALGHLRPAEERDPRRRRVLDLVLRGADEQPRSAAHIPRAIRRPAPPRAFTPARKQAALT